MESTHEENRADKDCMTCGRSFSWRKKWESDWGSVKYCSAACRRNRPGRQEVEIEKTILDMVSARKGSVCPSEVAQALAAETESRALMEPVRQAARRLTNRGRILITQNGKEVGTDFRGPIRLHERR